MEKNRKEGTELQQAHKEGPRPGLLRHSKFSRSSSCPPPPLERSLLAAPTHTGFEDFTQEDREPVVFVQDVQEALPGTPRELDAGCADRWPQRLSSREKRAW